MAKRKHADLPCVHVLAGAQGYAVLTIAIATGDKRQDFARTRLQICWQCVLQQYETLRGMAGGKVP